jgi:hypothetical protein
MLQTRNPSIIGTVFNEDGPSGGVNAIGPVYTVAKRQNQAGCGDCGSMSSLRVGHVRCADYKWLTIISAAFWICMGVVASFADNRKHLEDLCLS